MPKDNAVESFLRTNIDQKICTKASEGSSTTYNGDHAGNVACHAAHIAVHSVGAALTAVIPGKSSDHDVSRIGSHYNAVMKESILPAANSICKAIPFVSDNYCDSLFAPEGAKASSTNNGHHGNDSNVGATESYSYANDYAGSGNDFGGIDVSHWQGGFNDNDDY